MIRKRSSFFACLSTSLLVIAGSVSAVEADEPGANPVPAATSALVASDAVVPSATVEPLSASIDRLISANVPDYDKLAAPVTNDAEFLRRISIDLTGAPPTSKQTREFLADTNVDKRSKLIDQLLSSPEFPRELARVLDQILMLRRPAQNVGHAEWKTYLHQSCVENKPWNVLVSEILSSDGVENQSRPASRFYLDRGGEVNLITRDIGQIFLGVNLECAQCHDHPHVDDWKQRHYYGISAFLVRSSLFKEGDKQVLQEEAVGEVKFESVFEIRDKVSTGPKTTLPRVFEGPAVLEPKFDFGQEYLRAPGKDIRPIPNFSRRQQLADAVTDPNNRQFPRTIANRLWATFMGRGLVHPIESDHSDNPASHPELMNLLADNIAARHYDLKAFIRDLVLSKTYQRSSQRTAEQMATPMPEPETFAVAPLRGLMAEQMAWSTLQATGVTENYRVNLGANLTEAKLYEQLSGTEQHFVNLFGGEPGKAAKDFETSIEQTLWLSNDPTIQGWLVPSGVNLTQRLTALPQQEMQALAEELYLSCLTRQPTAEDVQDVAAYLADRTDSRPAAYQELVWALVTSAEFRFNH